MDARTIENEIVARVLRTFPHVERVILFGSRATDHARPDSDYDVLVVAETNLSPAARGASLRLALKGLNAAFDLVVVTPKEFSRLLGWRSSVVFHAVHEGKKLHAAA